jgi:hypothetical protein
MTLLNLNGQFLGEEHSCNMSDTNNNEFNLNFEVIGQPITFLNIVKALPGCSVTKTIHSRKNMVLKINILHRFVINH